MDICRRRATFARDVTGSHAEKRANRQVTSFTTWDWAWSSFFIVAFDFLGLLGHGLWREYNQDGQLVEQEVRRLLATAAYKDVVLTSPKKRVNLGY
ncbi:hypothetical protein A8V49_08685 [Yersinia pestis]|nr:hypothetical protein AU082_14400 [Yersinia pestis]PCN67062.1 hypothetical protein A8V49_08685 [Yersinia pestis]